MKRFFAQLKKLNVRRAVLSKTAARVFVGVIACLLWDRFLNSAGRLSVLGHAFMAVGLLFAAFAWMHYLSLDGFKLFPPAVRSVPKRRAQSGMTDALNEDPDADVLDKQARTGGALAAFLCAGALFINPPLLAGKNTRLGYGPAASFIISKDRERPCHPCSQKVSASTPARREECP